MPPEEEKILEKLEKVIKDISEIPQINITGVKKILEEEIGCGEGIEESSLVYKDILDFYNGLNEQINQVGALKTLSEIQKKYWG